MIWAFSQMGNANGKEDDATAAASGVTSSSARSNGGDPYARSRHRRPSSDSMSSSPPGSPARSPSPFLFAPQVSFSLDSLSVFNR